MFHRKTTMHRAPPKGRLFSLCAGEGRDENKKNTFFTTLRRKKERKTKAKKKKNFLREKDDDRQRGVRDDHRFLFVCIVRHSRVHSSS